MSLPIKVNYVTKNLAEMDDVTQKTAGKVSGVLSGISEIRFYQTNGHFYIAFCDNPNVEVDRRHVLDINTTGMVFYKQEKGQVIQTFWNKKMTS